LKNSSISRRSLYEEAMGMILAIDLGDLNRDGAPHSEGQGRVPDGDRGVSGAAIR